MTLATFPYLASCLGTGKKVNSPTMRMKDCCAVLIFSLLTLAEAAKAAGPFYRLGCRGGDNLPYTIRLNLGWGPAGTPQWWEPALILYFSRANHAVGAGLSPGECSWFDRPMKANEPQGILLATGNNAVMGFQVDVKVDGNQKIRESNFFSGHFNSWFGSMVKTLSKSSEYLVWCVRRSDGNSNLFEHQKYGDATLKCD